MKRISFLIAISFVIPAVAADPAAVYQDRRVDPVVMKAASELRDAGKLADGEALLRKSQRTTCKLVLPKPRETKLEGREIWKLARQSYLRVGWFYQCKRCDKWHTNLAGGYVITEDGVALTCEHVIKPPPAFLKGHLIVATDDGEVLPVTDILATDALADIAVLKLATMKPLIPLPLSADALPGDTVFCFSDPMEFRGYFSQGIVNRYYRDAPRRARSGKAKVKAEAEPPPPPERQPLLLNVSTDWAPGSSGAAVLDQRGNAIGHVARILPVEEELRRKQEGKIEPGTLMVMHEAVPVQEVLRVIVRE